MSKHQLTRQESLLEDSLTFRQWIAGRFRANPYEQALKAKWTAQNEARIENLLEAINYPLPSLLQSFNPQISIQWKKSY